MDINEQREKWRKAAKKKRENPEYRERQRVNYRKWYAERGRNRNDNYMECILEWREEHPERLKAYSQLNYAIKRGEITKPNNCEKCARETHLSGHHEDYSKPLEVQWLCASCHKLKHSPIA